MKVFFLVDTPLAGDISSSVSRQLLTAAEQCEFIAFVTDPRHLQQRSQHTVNRHIGAGITVTGKEDYPGCGALGILRAIGPDIYVTIDDIDPLESDFLMAAQHLEIPTLLVQPGIWGEQPFTWRNLKLVLNLFTRASAVFGDYRRIWTTQREMGRDPFRRSVFIFRHLAKRFYRARSIGHGGCTRIAVSGDFARDLLIRQGISPDNVIVTGQPRFDSAVSQNGEKDTLIRQLESTRGKKIVLYLPDHAAGHKLKSYSSHLEAVTTVVTSCRQLPEALLVVKPHHGQSSESYKSIVEGLGYSALIYNGSNLHDLIRASDVVITGISTSGLETLALDKPLIIMSLRAGSGYFPRGFEYIPYVSSGVALGVHHPEELPAAIRSALHDSDTREKLRSNTSQFLYHHVYHLDGKASERVANLILDMAGRQPQTSGTNLG
jgi:hypothetical protein